MSWVVRPMTAEDIDSVLALEQSIPQAPHWSRASYELEAAGNHSSEGLQRVGFVAFGAECLLGFVIGKLVAGICEIESIAVAGSARGQGIGLALVSALTAWAKLQGAARVELEVRASNAAALRLYRRAGLRQEGLRKRYYDDPEEDAVLMGMGLDAVENFPEKRIASGLPEC